MLQNYSELPDLQPMTIFVGEKEIEGEFTDLRVDRNSLPDGLYAYDLREGEDGDICTIEEHVLVNHFGTFISKEPIDLGEEGRIEFDEENGCDYSFY